MQKIFYFIIILLFISSCASRGDVLSKEYEKVSREIEGLQNEQKAIVNLQYALEEYLKAEQTYNEKKDKLIQIRQENNNDGMPIGPKFNANSDLQGQVDILNKNLDQISDQVRSLEKKRSNIVSEQTKLEQ